MGSSKSKPTQPLIERQKSMKVPTTTALVVPEVPEASLIVTEPPVIHVAPLVVPEAVLAPPPPPVLSPVPTESEKDYGRRKRKRGVNAESKPFVSKDNGHI